MSEILDLAKGLSNLGFPTLMVIILYGSYRGWWVWGRVNVDMKDDYVDRLLKMETSRDKWQAMALRATGLAEETVSIVKKSNGAS